jgi:hypothetical protein
MFLSSLAHSRLPVCSVGPSVEPRVRGIKMKRIVLVVLACVTVVACSHGLSGTYLPKGGGVGNGIAVEKLEFLTGDTVDLTMMEQKIRANYKVDGKQVLIIVNGVQQVFNLDADGCLDGGNMFGKFCKS